ncbi:MBL fold metallo-hydrolase [Bacillus suaedaesalsae]|uniref:MBL fold metallo-hydrolase n=1 Tax=Bacillus suaedaesalsae TaxID=2810349 RepID=A0ABS2DFM5_9BACI|nr:MBL fold metallo-hydrolase [Bacillus suaedaesalsae]MBM6617268.1 MBL fold metallo-hydrolase [Bacillus suaedaesalsae]
MKWRRMPLGPIGTNAYIISNDIKECLIIDPGAEAQKIFAYVNEHRMQPLAILLTHAHYDHIGAVDEVREKYTIPVYIHKKEKNWLLDPALNLSFRVPYLEPLRLKEAEEIITGDGELSIGGFHFTVFETPGHSPGSVSFYFKEHDVIFSGDALFEGSIGRTDLPGGNTDQLLRSIHDKLLTLPEETLVLSGHGLETTIQQEMDTNPFLNGY